jgi:hypothetical protein
MEHDELLALFDRQLRREAVDDTPGTAIERVGDLVRRTVAAFAAAAPVRHRHTRPAA